MGPAAVPILIVSYRNPDDVAACLHALGAAAAEPAFRVFVCENGGAAAYDRLLDTLLAPDGPCAGDVPGPAFAAPAFVRSRALRLRGRRAGVRVDVGQAAENTGYAGGINAWLRPLLDVPGWPAVWILNPDTRCAPDALAELAAHARRWDEGMVGSRLVPTNDPDLVHSRGLAWSKRRAVALSVDLRASAAIVPDPQRVDARIDAPSGASMYVTRACIERIGLMDERYFLYFEDLDWGLRAKRCCGVGYAHRSVVVHTGGTTIGGSVRAAERSPLSTYLESRNSILFVRARYPLWLPWTVLCQLLRSAKNMPYYRLRTLWASVAGTFAGLCGKSGRPDALLPPVPRTEGPGH